MTVTGDGDVVLRLREACSRLAKDGSCDEGMIRVAEEVLDSKGGSIGSRKLAAQLLHKSGRGRGDWLHLAVAIDGESPEFVVKVAKIWLKEREHCQIGATDDEFLFFSSLILRASKIKGQLKALVGEEEFTSLRKALLWVAIAMAEVRSENCTQLLKAVAKLFDIEKDISEILQLCVDELPADMSGSLLLASILYTDRVLSPSHMDYWLSHIKNWALEQEVASAASSMILRLLFNKEYFERVVEALTECLLSSKSVIRVNTLRCWFGRICGNPVGISAIRSIFHLLNTRWDALQKETFRSCWPPNGDETEDISCVDPLWDWAESDGVTWMEDRILSAYLSLVKLAQGVKVEQSDPLLLAALRWHEDEIRLEAFKLLVTLEETKELQEEFLLFNYDTVNETLRRVVSSHGSRFEFSEEGKKKWRIASQKTVPEDENCRVFLPDSIACPSLPEEFPQLAEFVEKLLVQGGSQSPNDVPSFPELYANLDSSGINHRVYAKLLTDAMEKMSGHSDAEYASDFMWNIVSRCRMKAVVDCGCSHLESLLSSHPSLVSPFFSKAVSLILDPSCTVRTLVLSRLLWACCEADASLFAVFWGRLRPFLLPSSPPSVITRLLKTLKLFLSMSSCDFPAESVPILFFFCLDAQEFPDFLTRSSATIVFGFLLRSITTHRIEPLFKFMAVHRDLWNQMKPKLRTLSSLPRIQRILLLTCLARFTVSHTAFYADHELETLGDLLDQLNEVRLRSPDVRERRFCIDALIQLTPRQSTSKLKEMFKCSVNSGNSASDLSYLLDRLTPPSCEPFLSENIMDSEYYRRIESVDAHQMTESLTRLRQSVDLENELSAQGYAVALVRLSQELQNTGCVDPMALTSLCSAASSLADHPFSRVRSLVSRVAAALGCSRLFLHGKYLKEALSC